MKPGLSIHLKGSLGSYPNARNHNNDLNEQNEWNEHFSRNELVEAGVLASLTEQNE